MVEVSLDNSMFLSETANFSEESYNRRVAQTINSGTILGGAHGGFLSTG